MLAVVALGLTGCAAQRAASVEPTVTAPAPAPRPTAQPGFASRGPAEVVHRVDTKDKVVFLTIDDGLDPDPALQRYLQDNDVPVTVFLTTGTVTGWNFWKDMGGVASIQNHTVVHPALPKLGAKQGTEICEANAAIAKHTGQSPWMLRPPYGSFNSATLSAAGECGLDWVVHWSVSLPGGELQFQKVGGSLKPGDVILTHFRPELADQLPKVVDEIRAQGFEIARLEDYLLPRGSAPTAGNMQMSTPTESRAYLVAD